MHSKFPTKSRSPTKLSKLDAIVQIRICSLFLRKNFGVNYQPIRSPVETKSEEFPRHFNSEQTLPFSIAEECYHKRYKNFTENLPNFPFQVKRHPHSFYYSSQINR